MEKYVKDVLDGYEVNGRAATPASVNLFELRESDVLGSDDSIEFCYTLRSVCVQIF